MGNDPVSVLRTDKTKRDVYGDSVDKIVQGNTSNIVFLKSTDDTMLETLSKMSGTRHKTYKDSKTITRDMAALTSFNKNEGKTSYTMTTKEEPVISYNDMAFISPRNSIVFRAGDAPIWNRNETILPMSWRLFSNTIIQPGKSYSLQTIPTLSTAMDFDVRKNQPDFTKMLETRMNQAYIAKDAVEQYRNAYGYSDYDIDQLDPDTYSDELMDLICTTLAPDEAKEMITRTDEVKSDEYEELFEYMYGNYDGKNKKFDKEKNPDEFDEFARENIIDNKEQLKETASIGLEMQELSKLRYAECTISRDMLCSKMGMNHSLDEGILSVYQSIKDEFAKDTEHFRVVGDELLGTDGRTYIMKSRDDIETLNKAIKDDGSRMYSDEELTERDMSKIGSFEVTNDFLRYLVSFTGAWPFANGRFEKEMAREMRGERNDEKDVERKAS